MALIGQYNQTAFTAPTNGQTGDADTVRANDNATATKHNSHDNDSTIHCESGVFASRPAFGTAGRKYLATDTGRLYYDTGSAWAEIPYSLTGGNNTFTGSNTFNGATTLNGAVGVVDDVSVVGNVGIVGNLSYSGTLTGTVTVPAANVQAGTLGAGNFTTNGNLTAANGHLLDAAGTNNSVSGTVNVSFATTKAQRITLTGTTTATPTNVPVRNPVVLEILQDATGSRALTLSGVVWPNSTTPTFSTTANRKDVVVLYNDGAQLLAALLGPYVSTG